MYFDWSTQDVWAPGAWSAGAWLEGAFFPGTWLPSAVGGTAAAMDFSISTGDDTGLLDLLEDI